MKSPKIDHITTTDRPLHRKVVHLAVASCITVMSGISYAQDATFTVSSGSAKGTVNGSTLTVNSSNNAILKWPSFNILKNETVHFEIANAGAILNRVAATGGLSNILGTLSSNGKVFLINPSGILIGKDAHINTAGFVASTLNMTDADFLNGKFRFNADPLNAGKVTNAGEIVTPSGGFVYLIAPQVENSGIITTPSGEAILAAGHSVEVVDSTDPSLHVVVRAQSQDVNLSQAIIQNGGNIFSVLNSGTISANTAVVGENGKIQLRSAGNLQTTATSKIEAKGDINTDGGRIRGFADGQGTYAGSFDVSGKNGGFIETSAANLDISGITSINASALSSTGHGGEWLLDPYDFTIGATEASLIGGALNMGANVTVDTSLNSFVGYPSNGSATGSGNGDITVNSAILANSGYGGAVSLNLIADGKITINAKISDKQIDAYGGFILSNGDTVPSNSTLSLNMIADRDSVNNPNAGGAGVAGTDISSNGGIFINRTVDVQGNITIANYSNKVVLDANAAQHDTQLIAGTAVSSGNSPNTTYGLNAYSAGGFTLQGGNDNSTTGSGFRSTIRSYGNMDIASGGDITLIGGTGNTGQNSAKIVTGKNDNGNNDILGGYQRIGFTTSGNTVTLTGGSGAGNNTAMIINRGLYQYVGGITGFDATGALIVDVNGIATAKDANNPIFNITGGTTSVTSANAGAGIFYMSGHDLSGGNQTVHAKQITMHGGSGNNTNAFIASISSGINQDILIYDGVNFGSLTMTGGNGANSSQTRQEAGIGTPDLNIGQNSLLANISVTAGNITMNAGSQMGTESAYGGAALTLNSHGIFTGNGNLGQTDNTISGTYVNILADKNISLGGNIVTRDLLLVADYDKTGNDGGVSINNEIFTGGNILVGNWSNAVTLDAASAGHSVSLNADGDIGIYTAGGLVLTGGTSGTHNVGDGHDYYSGNHAEIHANGNIDIASGGNITLTGGSGVGGNYAKISTGDDQNGQVSQFGGHLRIGFTTSGNTLSLTGGSSSGGDSHASIKATTGSDLIIAGMVGVNPDGTMIDVNQDGLADPNTANNPFITITGGTGGSRDHSNEAGINLRGDDDGGGNEYINARTLTLQGGAGVDANAHIGIEYGNSLDIQVMYYDVANDKDVWGAFTMNGVAKATNGSNGDFGGLAGIGSTSSSVNINLDAGSITLNTNVGIGTIDDVVYTKDVNGAITDTTTVPNTGAAYVTLTSHDGNINITNAKIGASSGAQGNIDIEANGGNITVTNSSLGFNSSDGYNSTVSLGARVDGSQGGVITINNTGTDSGIAADSVYLHADKNIAVTGNIYASNRIDVEADYDHTGDGGISFTNGEIGTDGYLNVQTNSGNITASGVSFDATTANFGAYGGDIGTSSHSLVVNANNLYVGDTDSSRYDGYGGYVTIPGTKNVYITDLSASGSTSLFASQHADLILASVGTYKDGTNYTYTSEKTINIYAPDARVSGLGNLDLNLDYTSINFNNNTNKQLAYGGPVAAGIYAVIAPNLYLNQSNIGAGYSDELGIFASNIQMTNHSEISAGYLGINLDPDSLVGIAELGSLKGVINTLTGSGEISVSSGSHINGTVVGINTGTLNLTGTASDWQSNGTSISGEFLDIIAIDDINIVGGSNQYYGGSYYGLATINAYSEAGFTVGGNITLTTGSHNSYGGYGGSYGGAAQINVESPSTLYMAFPTQKADGFSVDGVANAFRSTSNQNTGIYVYNPNAAQGTDSTLPVLGTTTFVTYQTVNQKQVDDIVKNVTKDIVKSTNTNNAANTPPASTDVAATMFGSGNSSDSSSSSSSSSSDSSSSDKDKDKDNKDKKDAPKSCS